MSDDDRQLRIVKALDETGSYAGLDAVEFGGAAGKENKGPVIKFIGYAAEHP